MSVKITDIDMKDWKEGNLTRNYSNKTENSHDLFLEDIEKKLRNLSETHLTLYVWGKSVIELWETDKQLRPLKEEAQKNKEEKERLDAEYTRLNKEKEEKEKELQALEDERNKSDAIINDLETKKKINSERKNNASLLLTLLKDEGINFILMKLQDNNVVPDENILSGATLNDKDVITFFNYWVVNISHFISILHRSRNYSTHSRFHIFIFIWINDFFLFIIRYQN